jgi:hypothetical protein
MVLQLSHKKEMVVPVRKKKEMVTHPLRVQLTRGKLMKKYLGGMKWRPMGMSVDWKRTPQMTRMSRSLVPRDWDSYNFSQLSVNPGENVAWEYRDNAVSVGTMYKSAVEVKDAVKRWSTLTL